jgi:hypothetical protein
MAKSKDDDNILVKMFEYLEQAKKLLSDEGFLQPTVFAHSPFNDSLLVLPIINEDTDLPDLAIDLVGKVIAAYGVTEYFVVSESYHMAQTGEMQDECLNVVYVGRAKKRLISLPFRRLDSGSFFFGEMVEILPSNVEGSVTDLFRLKERFPYLSEKEKAYIRLMFPAQAEDELAQHDYSLH